MHILIVFLIQLLQNYNFFRLICGFGLIYRFLSAIFYMTLFEETFKVF